MSTSATPSLLAPPPSPSLAASRKGRRRLGTSKSKQRRPNLASLHHLASPAAWILYYFATAGAHRLVCRLNTDHLHLPFTIASTHVVAGALLGQACRSTEGAGPLRLSKDQRNVVLQLAILLVGASAAFAVVPSSASPAIFESVQAMIPLLVTAYLITTAERTLSQIVQLATTLNVSGLVLLTHGLYSCTGFGLAGSIAAAVSTTASVICLNNLQNSEERMEPLSLLCHICRLACLPLICLSWLSGEWPRFLAEMTASGSTFSEILLLETTLWLCVRISNFYAHRAASSLSMALVSNLATASASFSLPSMLGIPIYPLAIPGLGLVLISLYTYGVPLSDNVPTMDLGHKLPSPSRLAVAVPTLAIAQQSHLGVPVSIFVQPPTPIRTSYDSEADGGIQLPPDLPAHALLGQKRCSV